MPVSDSFRHDSSSLPKTRNVTPLAVPTKVRALRLYAIDRLDYETPAPSILLSLNY